MPSLLSGVSWESAYWHARTWATRRIRYEVRGYKVNGRWRYSSAAIQGKRK